MKKATLLAAAGVATATLTAAALYSRRSRVQLEGRVVLITGGSRGLGLEIAHQCALRGSLLVLVARDLVELEKARASLVNRGASADRIQILGCDLADETRARLTVAEAGRFWGRVDVLINAAGTILVGPAEAFSVADFANTMQLNFFGALHTTLAVLPQMTARGGGSIVNIGSIGGKVPVPHLLPYVASKFALTGWSTGLRTELAPRGIRVLTVSPGVMSTGSPVQAFFKGDAAAEFAWFATSATLSLTAVDATSAARSIVRALERGAAELHVGLQAKLAARLVNLVPSATAAALSIANRFLPSASAEELSAQVGHAPVPGRLLTDALPPGLQSRNEARMQQHNQVPRV